MTDNVDTQSMYIQRYNVNRTIAKVYVLRDYSVRKRHVSRGYKFPRMTTMEDAVVDILIAAHGSTFKGSYLSSMSELVSVMRKLVNDKNSNIYKSFLLNY